MIRSSFFTALLIFSSTFLVKGQRQPTGLFVDLLAHTERSPAVVYSKSPLFSWIVPGRKNGTLQVSYHLIVSDNLSQAENGQGNVTDLSSRSDQSIAVKLGGLLLKPLTKYYWRVKTITNMDGESPWSEIKSFHTASELSDGKAASEALVKTRQQPLTVQLLSKGSTLLDFGKDAFGQLHVELSSDSGRDTVAISLGEALKNGRVDANPGGTIRYQKIMLPLEKGTHIYQVKLRKDQRNTGSAAVLMPDYIGEVFPFRYVELEGYNNRLSKKNIQRDIVHYPFNEDASYFKSSSDTLNKIWELCKYSIKATSFAGIYVDGDRERIPYEADALINQLGHYGVDREFSMARKSASYLLDRPTWPTEWILQALIISWNDYLYTGDKRLLESSYELLKSRTLNALKGSNGLISTSTGLQTPEFAKSIHFNGKIRDIVDWPVSETDGFVFNDYNTVVNAYYYKAIVIMEQISGLLGKKDDQIRYANESGLIRERFNRLFLDVKTGLYKDGEVTHHSSLHANMFAMNFGLIPVSNQKKVMEFIKSKGMASSVYGSQFLMESIYDGFDGEYALKLLTDTGIRSWYNMIRVGSTITLEAWDNKFKPNQDWNHAWGAAPANLIPRKLMGIEPMSAGFGEVSIMPQIGSLSKAEAVIPTIRGPIALAISNSKSYTVKITLPANMTGQVFLPIINGKTVVTKNGQVISTERVPNKPFLNAGKIQSGSYTFTMAGK